MLGQKNIAEVLARGKPRDNDYAHEAYLQRLCQWQRTVSELADALNDTTPKFNLQQFIIDCGWEAV